MFTMQEHPHQQSAFTAAARKNRDKPPRSTQMASPSHHALQMLQRHLGNSYLQAIDQMSMSPCAGRIQRACTCSGSCTGCIQRDDEQQKLQTKLIVGAPDDLYEQEADRMSEQVLHMGDSATEVGSDRSPVGSPIQRIPNDGKTVSSEPPDIDADLSGGQPLPPATRAFMEPRFGSTFEHVRLHTDERAQQQAAQIHARAFTYRNHIWLGRGESAQDKRLIAHELTHVVQQNDPALQPQSSLSLRPGIDRLIQRYSHQDCTEDDLRNHIWPADWSARQMTAKALRVLGGSPIPPSVTPLLTKYFMTATPNIATIRGVYNTIESKFTDNNYQYECEDDCPANNLGYVYGAWSDIHLCLNTLRGWSNDCIARTIVHEFSHYYAGTDDKAYCKSGCSYSSCPTSLSETDALENADSYACFAYELYPMAV